MVDIRSAQERVRQERRSDQRLEFHCDAMVQGITGMASVTDISIGGIFIELQSPQIVKKGKLVAIKLNLPTEHDPVRVNVKFVSQSKRGIGCEFKYLNSETKAAIRNCFETFKDTIPIR